MTALSITLTAAGLAAVVADDGSALGPVQIAEIGLTNSLFAPSASIMAIPDEIKRLPLTGEASDAQTLHMVAQDNSEDTYAYRGFGIYLSDGSLFGTYVQSAIIAQKATVSSTYVALDIMLLEGQTDNISFGASDFLNPPATTARPGVVELATDAEAIAGTDAARALTPAALAAVIAALFPQGDNANGHWEKSPNGRIYQDGFLAAPESASPPLLPFPIPFTDFDSIKMTVTRKSPNPAATSGNDVGGHAVSLTHFQVWSDDQSADVSWSAHGR